MNKKEQQKLVALAKQQNGQQADVETLTPTIKQMIIGYLIANTSLTLEQIGVIVKLKSQQVVYDMFGYHKSHRDTKADYKTSYNAICEAMGTKNRL